MLFFLPLPTSLLLDSATSSDGMELATIASPQVTLPKRTRLNVRQSKDGCITCRARKVKCDETKPTCLRCHRAGKTCEGYGVRDRGRQRNPNSTPTGAIFSWRDSPPVSRSSSVSPVSSFCCSSLEATQSRLGLEILLQQRREQIQWDQQPVWVRLIAQSLSGNEAVSRAVVCLGASFEAHVLPASLVQRPQASAQKQQAINALQRELANPSQGLVSVFLACIILAAAEVLERHLANALVHLQGALQALNFVDADTFADLHSFARSLDLQTAWYQLWAPPRLNASFESWDAIRHRYSLAEIEASTTSLLHSCYHLINRAGKFKYRSLAHHPPALVLEQGRHIATLTDWLGTYGQQSTPRLAILRAQCFSTLIYISTILCPREVTYDLYNTHFQHIVDTAGEIVHAPNTEAPPILKQFKFQPGLFQPLYLTAMKCRDPQLRRRAVRLFAQLGIEGPWDARVMSGVAQRAIQIEEHAQDKRPIPEVARLHGCGVDSFAPEGKTFPIFIQAHFSLCTDVERMVQSSDYENSEHWRLWSEDLVVRSFHNFSAD